jgi:YD repeat-containing protein
VGSSNVYEAADSSYLQLIDYGSSLLVRTTDGTQMSYGKFGPDWTCFQIEDRNGNLIVVNYNGYGDITNVTDTLGRVITFNYDNNANLSTIVQTWAGQSQPHTLISFGWGTQTMQPSFALPLVGTYYNENIPVLTQVGFADGSHYNIQYNGSGQLNAIRRYSLDNIQRSLTTYDYESPNNDCPCIYAVHVSADGWFDENNQPIVATTQFYDLQNGSHEMIVSDGTIYKEFYAGSGAPAWQNGLVLQSEVWSESVRQKWTTTEWHQDTESVSYQTNPRATETNVYDPSGNHRRTKVAYTSFSLPSDVYEYDANGSTVLRRTHTDYNLNSTYTNLRIVGLPLAKYVCDGAQGETPCSDTSGNSLFAKTTYQYDEGSVSYQGAAVGHDDSSYATGFVFGRGNLTSTRRYNVTSLSQYTSSSVTYNTTGSPITMTDASNHMESISYSDSFSPDGTTNTSLSFTTLAYPTIFTDADGNSATLKYNYDFGVKSRTQGPPPQEQSQGAIQTFSYDDAARVQQITTVNTGAHTRYTYGTTYVSSTASVNGTDDLYVVQSFDGLGRPVGVTTNHPGSAGGYKAQVVKYDVMGRVMKQSNPTEVWVNFSPYGDDAAGWLYTQQTYDWKGRPRFTTNTDGTQKYASYSGCGCAGGEMVTLTDEVGRQQRVYSDVFGRQLKTEIMNGSSVYSTTTNTFNTLDQITLISQTDNSSGVHQDTTMSYDGYGRLQTKHLPEQQADPAHYGSSTDYTKWEYNPDDTVLRMTDARGVMTNPTYNGRHLLTGVNYTLSSGVPTTGPFAVSLSPSVAFVYDAAGNRTSLTERDGQNNLVGRTTYQYDQLSRMISESYEFGGVTGSYALDYAYNLANEVTSLTIPFTSQQIGYTYDTARRLSSVTASGFSATYNAGQNQFTQTLTSFASNITYRAWGARKSMTYGNTVGERTGYNARMEPTSYTLNNVNYTNLSVTPFANYSSMSWTFDYYDDGRLRHALDATNNWFDRAYAYDHAARLTEASTYRRAEGQSPAAAPDPYYQSTSYDVWSNTNRTGELYGSTRSDIAIYTDNTHSRRQGWTYDAAGDATNDQRYQHTFDADGRSTVAGSLINVGDGSSQFPTQPNLEITQGYDGDGAPRSRVQVGRMNNYDPNDGHLAQVQEDSQTSYYVRSTVLGGAQMVELNQYGLKKSLWIYAGGERIAKEEQGSVDFEDHNPATGSWVTTNGHPSYRVATREERDPVDAEIPVSNPFPLTPDYVSNKWGEPLFIEGGDPFDYVSGITLDGLPMSRPQLDNMIRKNGGTTLLADYLNFEWHRDGNDLYWKLGWGQMSIDLPATPQNPTPPSLRDAIDLAKKLLADPKGDCAGIFKKGNGLSTLNDLDKKNKIKIADTKVKLFGGPERLLSSMPGVGGVTTSKGIFINPAGRIAQGNPSPTGPFGKLTPLEAFAAAIIHEDAHKTGDFPYEAKPEDSIFHSADVVDACFGGRRP